jgi:oxygen-dependent protoporphyrinogen oxidase
MTQHAERIDDVLIIGGGITGLAAAYYLQETAGAAGQTLSYTLLESSERLGGKIITERVDGFTIEGGPDCVIGQKPWAAELARRLGLGDQLMGTNEDRRKTFVLNHGRLTPLPDGVMLIVPTRITPFVTSTLISWPGKIRMGMDLFIPAHRGDDDESVADFVRRRLGKEALDKIAEPLMGGIHVSDPELQSLLGTFPRFRKLEKEHRSLILGMLAAKRKPKASNAGAHAGAAGGGGNGAHGSPGVGGSAAATNGTGKTPAGPTSGPLPSSSTPPPTTPFISLRDGLGRLVTGVQGALTGRILTGTRAASITLVRPGEAPQTITSRDDRELYRVLTDDGRAFYARSLILATPSYVSGKLVEGLRPDLAGLLNSIRYVSTATVSLGYRSADLKRPLNGFGLVIPRGEGRQISACTWSSTKFNFRAPEGSVLVRCFVGGSSKEHLVDLGDQELLAVVRREVKEIMGLEAEPVLTRIFRWPKANPQYDVGHLDRVREIHAAAATQPGLFIAGSAFDGVGVPDCVRQGKEAAAKAIACFGQNVVSGAEAAPDPLRNAQPTR